MVFIKWEVAKRTHWMSRTRFYHCWESMKSRCNKQNHKDYKYYWGRWIIYDPEWGSFEWFYEDMFKSYSDDLTLDRKKVDWIYCKSNCRWITMFEQQSNKRNNIMYKWKNVAQWCRKLELNQSTVYSRIRIKGKTELKELIEEYTNKLNNLKK